MELGIFITGLDIIGAFFSQLCLCIFGLCCRQPASKLGRTLGRTCAMAIPLALHFPTSVDTGISSASPYAPCMGKSLYFFLSLRRLFRGDLGSSARPAIPMHSFGTGMLFLTQDHHLVILELTCPFLIRDGPGGFLPKCALLCARATIQFRTHSCPLAFFMCYPPFAIGRTCLVPVYLKRSPDTKLYSSTNNFG